MKKLLLLLCCLLSISSNLRAQIKLGSFYYTAENPVAGQEGSYDANTKVSGMASMNLSRGTGLVFQDNSSHSYVGILPDGQNETDAFNNNVYYQLTVNSGTNYNSYKKLHARLRTANEIGSATAAVSANISCRWYYSVDNLTYTPIGSSILVGNTVTAGVEQSALDLSGIAALQNMAPNTTVYFRLYAWGANGGSITNRGFGFGKSNTSGLEVLSLTGYAFDKPEVILGAWNFNGVNASSSSSVAAMYQNQDINVTGGTSVPMNIERGSGLNAGSLNNSFAMSLKPVVSTGNVPSNLTEAKSNEAYYAIKFKGSATLLTNILGYKMKFRNGTSTIGVYTKLELLVGDNNNNISAQSPVYTIDDTPVLINKNNTSSSGAFFSKLLDLSNVAATVPQGKNAELRLYVYTDPTSTSVFGLGVFANGDASSVELYGRLLTPAEYLQILPVTLTSFKATKQNNSVRLNWATASEKDNSYFNVLRAGEDKKFTNIGKVNANGTSSTAKEYGLTDYQPLAGANYYKLTQTDLDGKLNEVGGVQHVQFDLNTSSLVVVSGAETSSVKAILSAKKTDKATVIIYNVSGSVLYQAQLNINSGINEIVAPVNLNKGVYILKVKTQSGETWQAKFVR